MQGILNCSCSFCIICVILLCGVIRPLQNGFTRRTCH